MDAVSHKVSHHLARIARGFSPLFTGYGAKGTLQAIVDHQGIMLKGTTDMALEEAAESVVQAVAQAKASPPKARTSRSPFQGAAAARRASRFSESIKTGMRLSLNKTAVSRLSRGLGIKNSFSLGNSQRSSQRDSKRNSQLDSQREEEEEEEEPSGSSLSKRDSNERCSTPGENQVPLEALRNCQMAAAMSLPPPDGTRRRSRCDSPPDAVSPNHEPSSASEARVSDAEDNV